MESGLLRFEAARPSLYGLEMHLARMHRDIDRFDPALVVIDPLSALRGPPAELQATMVRMIDMLKSRGITAVFTSLREDGEIDQGSAIGVSSLMDAWIKLLNVEANGERARTLYVIKARGMRHSNQLREFTMSSEGIALVDAYIGPAGVLTGTARVVQEAAEAAAALRRAQESRRRQREAVRRRQSLERQIDELRANLEAVEEEEAVLLSEDEMREAVLASERRTLATRRGGTK